MKTIGVATGTRADFGLYRPVLRAIDATPGLEYALFVCGTHLRPEYGHTVDEITNAGFRIADCIDTFAGASSPRDTTQSMSRTLSGFGEVFSDHRPDILLVLGDRYEMFAIAAAALIHGVPLGHIHGGELSEGAVDDALRHSITKMSHLHFVSTEDHARRVVQLGEQPARVHVTGAPGLDNIGELEFAGRAELEKHIGIGLSPDPIVATFHPATLEPGAAVTQVREMLAALNESGRPVVVTYPNADSEGTDIIAEIESFAASRQDVAAVPNLGLRRYFGLMEIAFAMVGNSSSGLVEAASFDLPVINIGDRQKGRMRGINVIDAEPGRKAISIGLQKAGQTEFRESLKGMVNPYGDGSAGRRIAAVLADSVLDATLLKKTFHDMAPPANAGDRTTQTGQAYG